MRPEWLEPIVSEWGPPAQEDNNAVPERFRNPNTHRVETRCTRFWRWERPEGNFGVVFLGTSPLLKNAVSLLSMTGPAGRAEYSCRGDGVPYGVILTLMELAGLPPYLTTQQEATSVSTSQVTADKGDRVSDTENAAVETEQAEAPAEVAEDTAAEAGAEGSDDVTDEQ